MDQKLTQTKIHNAVASHFFNSVRGPNSSTTSQPQSQPYGMPTQTRAQQQAQEQLREVEEVLNNNMGQFEFDDEGAASQHDLMTSIQRRASRHIKLSQYIHQTIAMSLNIFTVLTAYPFQLFPKKMFLLYFLISAMVTYRFLYNYKSYTIFEFEDLYAYVKMKSTLQIQKLKQKKQAEPAIYYNHIIRYMDETFQGVNFEYKMQKKTINSGEEYLRRSRESQETSAKIMKGIKKVWKNIFRTLLFWKKPEAVDRFIFASEDQYLKYMKAEYWQINEVNWIYFMFLNPPIICVCYFGGFQIVFIDLLILAFMSKIYELNKAQQNGDKLLNQTLKFHEKKSQHNVQLQKQKNGKIVQDYIKLKQKQYLRQSENASRIISTQGIGADRGGPQSRRDSILTNQRPQNQNTSRQRGSVPSQERDPMKIR